jgi:hypothetical protein
MRTLILALVLVAPGLSACTTGQPGEGPSRQQDILTAEELSRFPELKTAGDAIQRLRPGWLQPRGTLSLQRASPEYPEVVVDGLHVGGLEHLRTIWTQSIEEMRFLSSGDATSRYGIGFPAGVIEVRTKA